MILRDYQQRAVESVESGWKEWRKQLGVAATGAGKTRIASELAALQKAGIEIGRLLRRAA